MTRTCVRAELPEKYNESERKLGRSRTAMYREVDDDWVFVLDLLKEEKER